MIFRRKTNSLYFIGYIINNESILMNLRHFVYSISLIYILGNDIVCLYSIVETFVFLILRSTNTFTLCMQRVNLNPTPLLVFLTTFPPNEDMFTYFWVASTAAANFVLLFSMILWKLNWYYFFLEFDQNHVFFRTLI